MHYTHVHVHIMYVCIPVSSVIYTAYRAVARGSSHYIHGAVSVYIIHMYMYVHVHIMYMYIHVMGIITEPAALVACMVRSSIPLEPRA